MNESEIYAVEYTRVRKGTRGRHPIQPRIQQEPIAKSLMPAPCESSLSILIDLAEVEVLRLVDLEGLYQQQAADEMGVSRGTVWRILRSARKKVIESIMEGRLLVIDPRNGVDKNE